MTKNSNNIGSSTGSQMYNGAPAESDRNSLTLGDLGPLLLHDVHLVDNLAHFNRESVPERRPHAKGSGAFGVFRVTHDVSHYTKADLFQPGRETRMLARFSTVAGELGSPDTWRDVRGFALRFYTNEGNFDIVGNNTPVFFVRDPMKFPHFIHSQKRTADSGLRSEDMQWDFWTNNPESAHQVTYLMGPRGLPRSWRHMNGYGSHTYMWINASGERFWVKYHFHTQQGVENLSNAEAQELAGVDADFHRRDLFEAIAEGNFPKWRFSVQIMPYEEAKTYHINPFDLTKTWSHHDYPLIDVGEFELNENPENYHAQIEQAAFAPSNFVPGTGFSPDKMLLGRVFAYADAQRYRIGPNYDQLPINQPKNAAVLTYKQDGPMAYHHNGSDPTYAPNSYGKPYSDFEGTVENSWEADGEMIRAAYTLREDDDDFTQAGTLVREVYTPEEVTDLVETVADMLVKASSVVRERAFTYWKNIDAATGQKIEDAVHARV
ncbi:catalase [Arcanobacterium pluranimalium]|uniref:catalase n=1 Tax=Arcanobacterium pluranimalium TaxID=108028 RepID=UPI001EF8B1A6|nr:catalase [Arcanobacterium pluranimalium]MBM7824261.1 catalase [Arcanobacterium pluranimalium]